MSSRRWTAVLAAVLVLLGVGGTGLHPAAAADAAGPALRWSSPADGAVTPRPDSVYLAFDPVAVADRVEVFQVRSDGTETQTDAFGLARWAPGYTEVPTGAWPDGRYHVRVLTSGYRGVRGHVDTWLTFDAAAPVRSTVLVKDVSAATAAVFPVQGRVVVGAPTRVVTRLTDAAGVAVEASTSRSGSWRVTLDATALADGPVTATVTLPDLPGAPTERFPLVKDTVVPRLVRFSDVPDAVGSSFTWQAQVDGPEVSARLVVQDRFGRGLGTAPLGEPADAGGTVSGARVDLDLLFDGPVVRTLLLSDGVNTAVPVPLPPLLKHVAETVDEAHDRLRAAGLDLGAATGPEQQRACPVPSSSCTDYLVWRAYQRGEIWTGRWRRPVEVHGAVLQAWRSAGGPDGPWGLPQSEEAAAGPARVSVFDGGRAYWSPTTGAWLVGGAHLTSYLAHGGPSGPLGPPAGAPSPVAVTPAQQESDVVAQPFLGGRVYVSASRETRALYGAVFARSRALGGEPVVGLPQDEEQVVAGVGRSVRFPRVRITWSPQAGAVVLQGAILAEYDASPGRQASFGLPLSDEEDVPGTTVGARQTRFQAVALVWSSRGGVHQVQGAILGAYRAKSALLGAPLTDEQDFFGYPGKRYEVFSGGRVYWSAKTGVHEVHAGILAAYLSRYGTEDLSLGLPVTDERVVAGEPRVDFEHGSIRWTSRGPVTTYRPW